MQRNKCKKCLSRASITWKANKWVRLSPNLFFSVIRSSLQKNQTQIRFDTFFGELILVQVSSCESKVTIRLTLMRFTTPCPLLPDSSLSMHFRYKSRAILIAFDEERSLVDSNKTVKRAIQHIYSSKNKNVLQSPEFFPKLIDLKAISPSILIQLFTSLVKSVFSSIMTD